MSPAKMARTRDPMHWLEFEMLRQIRPCSLFLLVVNQEPYGTQKRQNECNAVNCAQQTKDSPVLISPYTSHFMRHSIGTTPMPTASYTLLKTRFYPPACPPPTSFPVPFPVRFDQIRCAPNIVLRCVAA